MSAFRKYLAALDRLDNVASAASIQSTSKLVPLADSAKELAVPIVPVQLNENKILDTAPNDAEFFSVTLLADMVNLPLTTPKSQLQRSMFKYVAVLDLLDLQHSKQELHSKQEMLPATEQQLHPFMSPNFITLEIHHFCCRLFCLKSLLPGLCFKLMFLHRLADSRWSSDLCPDAYFQNQCNCSFSCPQDHSPQSSGQLSVTAVRCSRPQGSIQA